MLTLINNILDLSKIEAGKFELENVEFNLRSTLNDIIKVLSIGADEKGIELTHFVQTDVPDVLVGDSARLRQVIINLIGNAIKFTTEGQVAVRISLPNITDENVVLQFSVADTGCGIPLESQKKLFSPFIQADSSTTKKHGGTGLGLAISKELVTMMAGISGWIVNRAGERLSISRLVLALVNQNQVRKPLFRWRTPIDW